MSTVKARISVQFEDSTRATSSSPLYLAIDAGQTVAEAVAEAQVVAGLLDKLSGSLVASAQVVLYVLPPGGTKTAPDAGSNNMGNAGLAFRNARTDHPWDASVPAIISAKISNGKLINSDVDVQNLINHLAGSSLPYQYTSDDGGVLTSFSYSFLRTREHTPVQKARSFSVR
jgi:hypothetical protein